MNGESDTSRHAAASGTGKVADRPIRSVSDWLRFALGFAVLFAVLFGISEFDASGRFGLLILAVVVGAGLAVERFVFAVPPRQALRRFGFGRPAGRATVVACVVGALIQLVYPLTTIVTGGAPSLRPGWVWLLVGIFAFHGLAEEFVWRGYAFRRLRRGRSFGRAVLWTMPLVAVAHVPIIVTSGAVVGAAALVVAAVTALPLAYLFDTGRGTIWAPAVVHTAIDSFKIVDVPAAALTTFSLLLSAISVVVPLLVLLVPRRVLDPQRTEEAVTADQRGAGIS